MKVYLTPEEVESMAQAATCMRDELILRLFSFIFPDLVVVLVEVSH